MKKHSILNAAVIISALGYFVDIYDLILFSIVRVTSLKSLGVDESQLLDTGVYLINCQMIGMLVGGVLWGILGDKRGRLTVLFGSILLYSIANLANGAVTSVGMYAFLRLIAGIGLAGELGAGITLVAEILPKEKRGIGTTIVAAVGILGAVLANKIAENYDWRTAYYIGGVLGLLLLILRVSVFESHLFEKVKETKVARGQFHSLFQDSKKFFKYLYCILIGVPIWFVIGILLTFSPEFAKALSVEGEISPGKSIMYGYLGLSLGDFASGFLSQMVKSRKRVVILFMSIMTVFILTYLFLTHHSVEEFYLLAFLLGLSAGYWALFVTVGSEQFGTNIRATVATTVPNFVRGSLVPMSALFSILIPSLGIIHAALSIGSVALVAAFISAIKMEETFSKDLNYTE